MGRNQNLLPAEPQLRPPTIPNRAFDCAMFAGRCGRPATFIVDAHIRIGIDDYEPLRWMTCDALRCVVGAQLHAETFGIHMDTRPLTVAEAEEITGYLAVTA